jgi:8-oxo-dGTP diphosphatase
VSARNTDLPTVRVSAIIIVDRRLVVVRQGRGDAEYWLLPGGGVELGESMTEALTREILEELGQRPEIARPVAIVESISPDMATYRKHVLHVMFAASLPDERLATTDSDVRAVATMSADDLESLDLRPPIADFLIGCLSSVPPGMVYLGRRW